MTIYGDLAATYDITLVAICCYAVLRGGRPERWGALINLAGAVLSSGARLSGVASWAPGEWIVLMIDIGVALGFYRLATTTTRFWPIWALGFSFADLFVNVAGRFLPGAVLLAYETGLSIYAYLALVVLGLGTYRLPADADNQLRSGVRSCHSQTTPNASASDSNSPGRSSKR